VNKDRRAQGPAGLRHPVACRGHDGRAPRAPCAPAVYPAALRPVPGRT